MIEATGVSLRYPDDTLALQNINLQIKPGEMVYITGPSGSGKTSLLKLFMGIEYPTSGSIKVIGQPITKGQPQSIRKLRRVIGPVFQEFKLLKGRTVQENVILGMRFLDIPKSQLKEKAHSALQRVGLEHKALSLVENLSQGESQRVAIARAVARRPSLILADEPTGNLDKDNAVNILELLASLRDEQTTVIITTHATHLIRQDKNMRLLTMERGTMSWER